MTYLLTKLIVCLLLASILGLLLGWLFRGLRSASELQKRESDWQEKLTRSESGAVALKSGLEQSNQKEGQLRRLHGELVTDNKILADECYELNDLTKRTRIVLKKEREESLMQEKQNTKKMQQLSNKLSLLQGSSSVLEAEVEKERETAKQLKKENIFHIDEIAELSSSLETVNQKNEFAQEEVYRLGKALNEASVETAERAQAIQSLESRLAEHALLSKTQAQQLEDYADSQAALLTQIQTLEAQLENNRSVANKYQQGAANQAAEYRQTQEQLQRQVAALETGKAESEDGFSRLQSDHLAATTALDTLQQKFADSNLNLTELKQTNQQLTTQFNSANSYQKEAGQLKQTLLEKEQSFQQLDEKWTADGQRFEEEKKALRSILDSTQSELQTRINSSTEVEQQMLTIQKQYSDLEQVLEQTQQRLKNAENAATDELAELRLSESEQQQELEALQDGQGQSHQKVKDLQQANLQLSDLIDQGNSKLRTAEEKKIQAEQALAAALVLNQQAQSEKETASPEKPRQEKLTQETPQKNNLNDAKPASLSAPRGGADDLKRISGIGLNIEGILNDLGIYHFEQVANFTSDNVSWVNNHLSFKGRIQREGWVEQAKALAHRRRNRF